MILARSWIIHRHARRDNSIDVSRFPSKVSRNPTVVTDANNTHLMDYYCRSTRSRCEFTAKAIFLSVISLTIFVFFAFNYQTGQDVFALARQMYRCNPLGDNSKFLCKKCTSP